MGRIVSIGECMGELSETGSPGTLSMGFAGDTLNTAYYLRHSLGEDWQVDYVSAVGTDGLSDRMIDFLKSEGIGTDHVRRLADKTIGLYYITLKDGERSFTYWRNDSAAKRLASDPAALNHALEGADLAYWSGITLAILSNQDRLALIEALGQFAGKGGTVVFDPIPGRVFGTIPRPCAAGCIALRLPVTSAFRHSRMRRHGLAMPIRLRRRNVIRRKVLEGSSSRTDPRTSHLQVAAVNSHASPYPWSSMLWIRPLPATVSTLATWQQS